MIKMNIVEIVYFAGGFFRRISHDKPAYETELVKELPEVLKGNKIYLVGGRGDVWEAAFFCPCQCGSVIQLSTLDGDSPSWRILRHWDGSVSLYPSVWRTKGCKSHFFFKRGSIVPAIGFSGKFS